MAEQQPISVDDLARFGAAGDSQSAFLTHATHVVAAPSPDGQHYAVVLRQGNPAAGSVDGKLLIYEKQNLFAGAKPRVVARISSKSLYEPITKVQWLADNRHLLFLGSRGESSSQIFSVDSVNGRLRKLTKFSSPVYSFAVTSDGMKVVVVYRPQQMSITKRPECALSGCLIPTDDIAAIDTEAGKKTEIDVLDTRRRTTRQIVSIEERVPNVDICEMELEGTISPDGKHALIECRVKTGKWPAWWHDYTADPRLPTFLDRGNNLFAELLVLVELRSGRTAPVNGAPYFNNGVAPVWIDNDSFLVAGQLESLDGASANERTRRAAHRELLLVNAGDRSVQGLADIPADVSRFSAAGWDSRQQMLTLSEQTPDGKIHQIAYRRAGEKWDETSSPARGTNGDKQVTFWLNQSSNDRPILMATDPVSGRSIPLLDPNPWLKSRKLGRVETVSWSTRDGHHWTGDLYFPPAYAPGVRYPLVIQTHGAANDEFSLSGTAGVNFLGQALAANNIVVLQIGHFDVPLGGKEELPGVQVGFEAAIDYLDDRKLIQRDRVAIQGYSRTGMHVAYTMTHSSYRFAAAALTSTVDYGWLSYLTLPWLRTDMVSLIGGVPFGTGLQKWATEAPSFHLDAVKTPMFLSDEGEVRGLWDWFAGLRILGKPVEYLVMPNGAHGVLTVPQQLKENQLLEAWYRFWLQGYEDPAPDKADQYRRWEGLCELQIAANTDRPTFCVPAKH